MSNWWILGVCTSSNVQTCLRFYTGFGPVLVLPWPPATLASSKHGTPSPKCPPPTLPGSVSPAPSIPHILYDKHGSSPLTLPAPFIRPNEPPLIRRAVEQFSQTASGHITSGPFRASSEDIGFRWVDAPIFFHLGSYQYIRMKHSSPKSLLWNNRSWPTGRFWLRMKSLLWHTWAIRQ